MVLLVTITDGTDASCTIVATIIDPNSCSNDCNLAANGLLNIVCNNNGTGSNPSDDYITFSLNPTGANVGTTYSVIVSGGTITPTSGTYGAATTFQLQGGSAGAGNVTVTITDDTDLTCSIVANITDPNSCSNDCDLTANGLANIACNDGGTNANPNDDFITFDLNPSGVNLAGTYNVLVSGGTITPTYKVVLLERVL